MKILSLLILALIAPGCRGATPQNENCSTVVAVKSSPELCTGHPIRIRAYLNSTRHGEYLVDVSDGRDVLSVEISESKLHIRSTSALLEKLGQANKGKPFASIYGTFEGRLVIDQRGVPLKFEIYTEVLPR